MPERKWFDAATMPNPLTEDVWAEGVDGQVYLRPSGLYWVADYRRWTPVVMVREHQPTPPPYEEPMPAIAPCRACGKPGKLVGQRCGCSDFACWAGAERRTTREAIEAWNAIMRK